MSLFYRLYWEGKMVWFIKSGGVFGGIDSGLLFLGEGLAF